MKEGFEFVDVFSFCPDTMASITLEIFQARSLIFLFPLSSKVKEIGSPQSEAGLVFMKQTIENACGTIALLHCLLNDPDIVEGNSIIDSLRNQMLQLTSPMDRAKLLEQNHQVEDLHASFAIQGSTKAPEAEDDVDLHFVAFIRSPRGLICELDGRQEGPLVFQSSTPTSRDEFFAGCCDVIQKKYIGKTEDIQVSAMALVPSPSSDL
jgi:ubiquitin carboxyl-terminal hydrolase L3